MEKTTIMAEAGTLFRARTYARLAKRTLSSVINEALEEFLRNKEKPRRRRGFPYEPLGEGRHPGENVAARAREILREELGRDSMGDRGANN